MNYVTVLIFVFIYLMSFVGFGIYTDEGLHQNKITEAEYRHGMRVASIPVINTLALILALVCALVHWLSFGMWDRNPKA